MTYDELDHTSQYGSIRKLHLVFYGNFAQRKVEVLYTVDLEFTTVSEDSIISSHKKNGSLLFLLCLIIGKLNEISKILMVRAHILTK